VRREPGQAGSSAQVQRAAAFRFCTSAGWFCFGAARRAALACRAPSGRGLNKGRHLPAAQVPQPHGEEPAVPVQISGRFDNYDGSDNLACINWETRFARGGIGAIISSFVPVHVRGRILPNYAMIDHDDKIPFWREVGGYNVFEPKDVGFVSQGPEAQLDGFRYETWQPGNSNQGHLSSAQLSDRDKDAVLEYLKTQ
jgi:hypothetical protein